MRFVYPTSVYHYLNGNCREDINRQSGSCQWCPLPGQEVKSMDLGSQLLVTLLKQQLDHMDPVVPAILSHSVILYLWKSCKTWMEGFRRALRYKNPKRKKKIKIPLSLLLFPVFNGLKFIWHLCSCGVLMTGWSSKGRICFPYRYLFINF